VAALDRATAHLGQTSTALSFEKLVEIAATDFVKGGRTNAIDIKQAAEQWIEKGQLIPLETKGQYATKTMLDTEKSLLNITQGRVQNMRTQPDNTVLKKLNVNQDNQNKIAQLYHSTKQFHVVNVFGSSDQIAENLLNVGNQSGKRVHLVSQTATDSKLNQQTISRQSHTLRGWVKNLFTEDHRHNLQGFLKQDNGLTNKDIILVDNAGKMSASELIDLTVHAKESQSKVIFLNKASSRQGLKAHSAIDLYAKGNVHTLPWVDTKQSDSQMRLHEQDTQKIANLYANTKDKSNTQILATSSVEQRHLTESIRNTLKNTGQLSRTGVHIETQLPHYLSKSQQELAKHYQAGMTLRHWQDGKPNDYLITKSDHANNTLKVLSQKNGKPASFDPSSRAFKAMDTQLFKPGSIELSAGERVTLQTNHKPLGLQKDETYVVSSFNGSHVHFQSNKGETTHVALGKLKGAPLKYDYVRSATTVSPKSQILLSAKSFALTKELLNEVTEKSQYIDVFTDNVDKAQNTIEKSEVRPSATQRVMHTQTKNDRYLSQATAQTLIRDVTKVLDALPIDNRKSVVEKSVDFAVSHISEKEAGFTQKELVTEAIRYAFNEAGHAVTKDKIEHELEKRSETLSAEFSDGTRWTTQSALDTEKHILANIKQSKGQSSAYATQKQVQDFLETKPRFTEGQKDATHLIATTKDRFVAVQGLAGTGKSTMLESNIALIQAVSEVGKNQPNTIIGLAPTHAAVSELESKGVKAQTLESLLTDIRTGHKIPQNYTNALFFLDESSMVSNRQAKEFTELVKQSQSKTVLLGDKEQLLSLSAGKPFEMAMTKGDIDTAYMTNIIRQKNDTLLGAVHNILDKQPDSALDKLRSQQPDTTNKSQHVISTLDTSNKDQIKAQQQATEALPWSVAQDYLARTPETRENTLIIAYTNRERDDITAHIRNGRMKSKEIGLENISTYRLRSVGASKEELSTMMPYEKGLVVSTKLGEFNTITNVDSENGIVTLQNPETKKEFPFLPLHRDHKFTTLFSVSEKPLSSGDKIMTRLTDKNRGIEANKEYTIIKASKDSITAISKDEQTLSINPKVLKDGHWDYAYTRTADMAQGSTYENVITAISGKGQLTNLRRAYIDISRGSKHVKLYTDNPGQMMKSWLSKDVHKQSAIETANQIAPTTTMYFNDNPLPHEDTRFQNTNGEFDRNTFKEYINNELPKFTESLAVKYLGAPNKSKSDRDYLTFGTGKTAIKVSLTGEHRGYFKDYTTGEKGSLINLMMNYEGIKFKDAMTQANTFINDPDKHQLSENINHEKLKAITPKQVAQFESRAKEYFNQSIETKGTLAERYLSNQNIKHTHNENVRFHGAVYSSEDRNTHPAMVTNIHNRDKETKAIEITYLDASGNKDKDLDINPRILGTKSKNLTRFNQGDNLNTTIISTSIESAFKIKDETEGNIDIINVNHKNDIQNISTDELRQHIIIVLDKENQNLTPNNIEKILQNFQNKSIEFINDSNLNNDIKQCIEKLHNAPEFKDDKDFLHKEYDSISINSIKAEGSKEKFDSLVQSEQLEHHINKPEDKQLTFDLGSKDSSFESSRELDRGLER